MSAPVRLTSYTLESMPLQRVCGWCRMELAPGRQPATHGICPACNVKLSLQAERRHSDLR